jgi:hypothetical protein
MNPTSSTNPPATDSSFARSFRLSRLAAIGMSLAIAGAAADGRAQTRAGELMPTEKTAGVVIDPGTRSIARLRLANGNFVDFIDLLDGHVGVGEKAKRGQRLAATYLASAWAATPLEIFLALAPQGSAVPRALQADHEDFAARSNLNPTPRDLTGHLTQGGGVSELVCSSQDTFYFAWFDAFADVTKYVFAEMRHQLSGQWVFYPGKHIYEGTNLNDTTYMGACNDHSFEPETLTMEVMLRIKTTHNGVTSYDWHEIAQAALDINEMYVFSSHLPAAYKARVKSPPDGIVEHFTVAVAYDKSPFVTSGF